MLSNRNRVVALWMLVSLLFALVSPVLAAETEQTAVAEQAGEKSEKQKDEKQAEKKDDKNSPEECVDPQAADESAFNTLEDIVLLTTGPVAPAGSAVDAKVAQKIEWKEVD